MTDVWGENRLTFFYAKEKKKGEHSMNRGTRIRTAIAIIALVNQALVTIGPIDFGNEVSNQRIAYMDGDGADQYGNEGYTEDGLVFQVTFERFNNGNVKVGAVNVVPTWVELDGNGYQIIGLEPEEDPWSWGAGDTYAAIASYNRTLSRLSDAYPSYRAEKNQEEVIARIE